MNPHARSLAAAVGLTIIAVAYFVHQGRIERPGPPRPAPVLSAARPPTLLPAPPMAADLLDQRVALDLRGEQIVRLKALDRLWRREVSGLTAMIHEAERDWTVFVIDAQGGKRASLPEIQRGSAEFGLLSAELRERRQQHSEAALRVLDDWQRPRLAPPRPPVTERRTDEAPGN